MHIYAHMQQACMQQACMPCVLLLLPRRSPVFSVCIQLLEPPPPPLLATIHSILAFLICLGGCRNGKAGGGSEVRP